MTTGRDEHISTFLEGIGWDTALRTQIAGDASNRRYERLAMPDGRSAILMDAPPDLGEDIGKFISVAEVLRSGGLSTPEIYEQDIGKGLLLIEDFGDRLFAHLMADDPSQQRPLYQEAANVLLALRHIPTPDLPNCDAPWLVEMVEPVFNWYARPSNADHLDEFRSLFQPYAELVDETEKMIMLRDFHVENLLLLPGREGVKKVGILDFQDAMLAHPAYDLVSILQDARRDVAPEIEEEVLASYLKASGEQSDLFRTAYAILGLQRNLRILGIFARLSLRDGKTHYVDMIPRVWGYVVRNLKDPSLAPLKKLIAATLPEPTDDHLELLKNRCSPS